MGNPRTVWDDHTTVLEPLLDLRDAAQLLSVSVRTIYRLVDAGELRPVRVGQRLRFEPSEMRRYLERESAE